MAPDAASAQSARGLSAPGKWSQIGTSGAAAWGLCQGSGSKPYQAQVDLSEPAFRCTCPSRKFPCKHGLALLLLLAEQPQLFKSSEPPEWVTAWLSSRAERQAKKTEKTEVPPATKDPAVQARTAAQRRERVARAVDELALWLADVVRAGLANLPSRPPSFWADAAARMVDAQAPGLARSVRRLSAIPASGAGWHDRMLESLAGLHLLLEGYRRLDALPEDLAHDIRSLVGWTQDQKELLQQAGVVDAWQVLGQRTETDENLNMQRCWLLGRTTGRRALVLTFSHGAPPSSGLVPGTLFEGALVFFPGRQGLRALVKDRGEAVLLKELPAWPIAEEIAARARLFASHPWLGRFPLLLASVVPATASGNWSVVDQAGASLLLDRRFGDVWKLAAASGGHPIHVFGEWDGHYFLPLSTTAEEKIIAFGS